MAAVPARTRRALPLVALVALAAGCGGGGGGGASDPAEQIAAGQDVYTASCAKCHGDQGQGGTGPVVIGGNRRIASYETTTRLYDYVSRTMPFDAPGTLAEDDYWNVIAFLLDENDLLPAGTSLGPDADPVELRR